jgi:hypothetical protein
VTLTHDLLPQGEREIHEAGWSLYKPVSESGANLYLAQ